MKIDEKSDQKILEIVNPIMDSLMEASTAIDYQKHIEHFSQRLRNILSKDHFEVICKKYQAEKGFFAERKIIGVYRRPSAVAVAWTQAFTKKKGEFIAEMLLIQEEDKYLVDHVMVW